MVNLPYAGHTNPTLPLARALVSRGHQVSYINAPEWREKIESTGSLFIPYVDYPNAPTEQQKKTRCFLAAYRTLMKYGAEYDVLLYEMLFFPAKEVGARLGIPSVRQFSQPAWNQSTIQYAKRVAKLLAVSCRLIEMQMFNRKTRREMNMEGMRMIHSIVEEIPEMNIVYVPEELQPCRETFDGRFVFVRPNVLEPELNPDPAFEYDKLKHPLIYISMGSIMSSKRFCKRCIHAFAGRDMTVLLTTARIPIESLGTLPSNIIARPFMPQLEILKNADLFITHGGMNSVNEAIHYGVPMLVLPVLNDQPINASMVEELGIGRRISPLTPSRLLYQNAVMALNDDRLRSNVKALSHQSKPAQNLSDVVDQIERLVR